MIIRSLVASTILAGHLAAGPVEAQVLLCPEAPPADTVIADVPAAADQLLQRLTIALDLHGHRGISEHGIMQAHAETPSALLAKLSNVVGRCMSASGDPEAFHEALPDLRKAFLEAADVSLPTRAVGDEQAIKKAALNVSQAERLEEAIDLSVRELWRKLWFRPAGNVDASDDRWAVIVASPPDADSGWEQLGEHQRRWIDTYFQLHEPYYDSNPHHAIVVGRRLPEEQAIRLRDYVIELGMADDTFLWPLPVDNEARDVGLESPEAEVGKRRKALDLSVLER